MLAQLPQGVRSRRRSAVMEHEPDPAAQADCLPVDPSDADLAICTSASSARPSSEPPPPTGLRGYATVS